MESKNKRKLSKAKIRTIIVAAVSAVIALALIITNAFIPVKYLTSYLVFADNGAEEGVMRVSFIDVGYGDCTLIELPDGKNMLIDAGDGKMSNQSRILKYLNSCKIDTIDYLVCTSVNSEHCGGLTEILRYKSVKRIYFPFCRATYVTDEYRRFYQSVNSSKAELIIAEYGESVKNAEYGYFFTFLSPSYFSNPEGEYAELNSNPESVEARNNASAVIWLEYGEVSFLLTSDAEEKSLGNICNSYSILQESYPVNLESCDIIKVANHGSPASACVALYDLTKPEAAIISVGENGRGCPSLQVIADAANTAGDKIFRTDEHGTVIVEVTASGYEIK